MTAERRRLLSKAAKQIATSKLSNEASKKRIDRSRILIEAGNVRIAGKLR
jgi:hypothetical protein